jgi:hypothetical protein
VLDRMLMRGKTRRNLIGPRWRFDGLRPVSLIGTALA